MDGFNTRPNLSLKKGVPKKGNIGLLSIFQATFALDPTTNPETNNPDLYEFSNRPNKF